MQVTVNIPEYVAEEAAQRGVSVEEYVVELLAQRSVSPVEAGCVQAEDVQAHGRLHEPADAGARLKGLAAFSDRIPPLPDVITREWIYQDHD